MDELFIGSALCEVTAAGALSLPGFLHTTVRRRFCDDSLFIGLHDSAPCLIAYDRSYATQRYYGQDGHGMRHDPQWLRRTYGFVERATLTADGLMTIPPLMRQRGRIGGSALLVATGQMFEIWDLEHVLQRGPSDLILLATQHRMINIAQEVLHVAALPPEPSPCCGTGAAQSGLCVQPMPALRPRHDPIGRGDATGPLAAGPGRLPGRLS